MFCENCGTRLGDGELFCSNCGARVNAAPQNPAPAVNSAPQYNPAPQQPYAPQEQVYAAPQQTYAPQFGAQNEPKPKKKKSKKPIIISAVALVLVAAFVVVAFATGLFGGGDKVVAGMEKKSLHNAIDTFHEIVDVKALTEGGTYTLSLEPGEYLKSLMSSQGLDLSWLSGASVEFATDHKDGAFAASVGLSLNGTRIADLNAVVDMDNGLLLLNLGDLADGYVSFSIDSLTSSLSNALSGLNLGSFDLDEISPMLSGSLPDIDIEKVLTLIEKYYVIAFNALDDPVESSGTFSANGVSQSCTVYTMTITQKSVYQVAKKVLESVVDDAEIKALLRDFYPMIQEYLAGYADYLDFDVNDFESVYSYLRNILKSYLDQFDSVAGEVSDETLAVIEDYAADGAIVGRRITVGGHEILFGNAHDGDRYGTEFAVDGVCYLLGSGTSKGSVLNGELQILSRNTYLATVKVIDFDYSKNTGSFEIQISSGAANALGVDSTVSAVLSALTFKINFTESQMTFDVDIAGQSALKASLTQSDARSLSFSMSGEQKDIQSWASSINLTELLNRLKSAGIPAEYFSSLNIR